MTAGTATITDFSANASSQRVVGIMRSDAWLAAITRILVAPYQVRTLATCPVIDLAMDRRLVDGALVVVEVNVENYTACCRLAANGQHRWARARLVGITSDLEPVHRHGLRVSGFAATIDSFTQLNRLSVMAERFFDQSENAEPTIEELVQLALPWPEFGNRS